jgi:hypothetical protein
MSTLHWLARDVRTRQQPGPVNDLEGPLLKQHSAL